MGRRSRGQRCSLALAVPLLAIACRKPSQQVTPSPVPSSSASASAALFVSPSLRCEECHGRIFGEWKLSAHAQAERSTLYQAMRSKAESAEASGCDRCHAPLAAVAPSVAGEGVGCDTCHSIRQADARVEGGGYVLSLTDNVKYGPLCDAKAHYFHKMGCSPLHNESMLCAGCHLWYRRSGAEGDRVGTEVPVFTEYHEWAKSPS